MLALTRAAGAVGLGLLAFASAASAQVRPDFEAIVDQGATRVTLGFELGRSGAREPGLFPFAEIGVPAPRQHEQSIGRIDELEGQLRVAAGLRMVWDLTGEPAGPEDVQVVLWSIDVKPSYAFEAFEYQPVGGAEQRDGEHSVGLELSALHYSFRASVARPWRLLVPQVAIQLQRQWQASPAVGFFEGAPDPDGVTFVTTRVIVGPVATLALKARAALLFELSGGAVPLALGPSYTFGRDGDGAEWKLAGDTTHRGELGLYYFPIDPLENEKTVNMRLGLIPFVVRGSDRDDADQGVLIAFLVGGVTYQL